MTKLTTICTALLLAAPGWHATAAVLYAPTPLGSSARISDYGSADQFGFRTFDNFTVAPGGEVRKVTWTGFWIDLNNPSPAAAPAPDALSWDIAFHADNVGTPGTQLSLESFTAASVSSTFLGFGAFSVAGGTYNVAQYRYSTDLSAPFTVLPATQYWISVLSRSTSYYPAFALQGATDGDDNSYQQTLGAALSVVDANAVARDRAIVLEGTAVPEPGSLCVAAGGLLLLAMLKRRTS